MRRIYVEYQNRYPLGKLKCRALLPSALPCVPLRVVSVCFWLHGFISCRVGVEMTFVRLCIPSQG